MIKLHKCPNIAFIFKTNYMADKIPKTPIKIRYSINLLFNVISLAVYIYIHFERVKFLCLYEEQNNYNKQHIAKENRSIDFHVIWIIYRATQTKGKDREKHNINFFSRSIRTYRLVLLRVCVYI